MYQVVFTESAKKQLEKLDKPTAALVVGWITKNLVGCEDPRRIGKPLKGSLSGAWRYRIGDYRIITNISESEVLITVVRVGHRKDIYEIYK